MIFAVAPLSSWGQGTTIKIYCGITPITITQSNVNNIVNAMMAGNPSTGAWTYIPNGSSISCAQVFSYNGIGNCMEDIRMNRWRKPGITETNFLRRIQNFWRCAHLFELNSQVIIGVEYLASIILNELYQAETFPEVGR